jgi:hypothetical protein
VIIGDQALVNPSADQVMSVLAEREPSLVPDDWEPGSKLGRAFGKLLRE